MPALNVYSNTQLRIHTKICELMHGRGKAAYLRWKLPNPDVQKL